ncbi:MAG: trigger factor [Clostridiales Family XIII bacterium]|jgi:trigger factor|nr:trigger factor [Clostridiales Family XIII bacterium]
MKSTFIERIENEAKFSMEFTPEEFENAQIEVYKDTKGRFKVDGFRTGKAPRKLIELHYGADIFFEEAVNELLVGAYPDTLDELGIEPVDRPNMDFSELEKGKGFTVTASVTVPPQVEISGYAGVTIPLVAHTVSDEDIEKELEALQNRNARLVLVDRPAEEGDTLLIDYAGFVGEDQFEGGTAERQELKLGSASFVPGFEEQLVGAAPEAEVDVKVMFPEEYQAEELAGKEAVFHCKVHEIKAEEKPEINDEFAQDVSEFETLKEFRADIRQRKEAEAAARSETEMKNAVVEKIYLANEINVPQAMIENQTGEMMEEFSNRLASQGLRMEQYFQYLNKTPEDVRAEFRDEAARTVKTRLLIKAVAEAEGIEASDEELDKEITEMAALYKTDEAKFRENLDHIHFKLFKEDIRNRKTVEFLYENAVKEESPAASE